MLLIAVLFAAPFIAHAVWRIARGEHPGEEGEERAVPVQALALTGAGLALIAVFVLAVLGGGETAREGIYTPPRLEGGRIVRGEIRQADETVPAEPGQDAEDEAPGEPPSLRR